MIALFFRIKSLSLLFKLTIYFKDIYTDLTEVKGYPMWAVLTLFVVITISLGLLLGIVFILIIDLLCPPKRPAIEEHKEIPVKIQSLTQTIKKPNLK